MTAKKKFTCWLCETPMKRKQIEYESGTGEYAGNIHAKTCDGVECPNCGFAIGDAVIKYGDCQFERWNEVFGSRPAVWLARILYRKLQAAKKGKVR